MKETIRKLNDFEFLQWFGLVCQLLLGLLLGLVAGFFLSAIWNLFGPQYHSDWQQFIGAIISYGCLLIGVYSAAKLLIQRQP